MTTVRDAFFDSVYKKIQLGEDIYIVTPDLGAPSLDDLRKYYPERFISVGIAEQSLITISAGLLLSGHKVIAYGLNPFPVTRAYDQIRCVMAELNVPLTLCGLNAGICSADAGYTHMAVDVFGMMRMLPNIQTILPSDVTMAECIAEEALAHPRPRYIMFDKAIREQFHERNEIDFDKGFLLYRPEKNARLALVGNGCYSAVCRQIVDEYASRSIPLLFVEPYAVPLDRAALLRELAGVSYIVTIEENVLPGGLGSYLLELLSDERMGIPVTRLGLRLESGVPRVLMNRAYLRERQGLDKTDLLATIDSILCGRSAQ